jgi:hypothetical protein
MPRRGRNSPSSLRLIDRSGQAMMSFADLVQMKGSGLALRMACEPCANLWIRWPDSLTFTLTLAGTIGFKGGGGSPGR